MHTVWSIPELLQIIFTFLDERSILAAGKVCRLFWLHSLPLIWKEVYDWSKLARIIPDRAFLPSLGSTESSAPERTAERIRWERFLLYSQLISSITIPFRNWLPERCQQLLELAPHQTVFPKLTCVHFNVFEHVGTSCMNIAQLFLPETITEVDIWGSPGARNTFGVVLDTLVRASLPNFIAFTITTTPIPIQDPSTNQKLVQVIQAHQGLRTLRLSIGDRDGMAEILRVAGELQKLRGLEVLDYDEKSVTKGLEILLLPKDLFPALEILHLSGTANLVNAIAQMVGSGEMTMISIHFSPPDLAQHKDPFQFATRFPHLRVLHVSLSARVSQDVLDPILECHELREFSIQVCWNCSIWMDEVKLSRMGRAWPGLEAMNLSLGFDGDEDPEMRYLGLSHLQIIAREFRRLKKLEILFSARKKNNEGFDITDATRISGLENDLQEMNVATSLIDKEPEKSLALIFKSWWPKLRTLRCSSEGSRWVSVIKEFYKIPISSSDM